MEQISLFQSGSSPSIATGLRIAADDLPSGGQEMENCHVALAIEKGWWANLLALTDLKADLHQNIRDQMMLGQDADELRELRQAVRILSDRIVEIISGHFENEHIQKARDSGWWDDAQALSVFQSDLLAVHADQRSRIRAKRLVQDSAEVIEVRFALSALTARLFVLRQKTLN